MLHCGFLNIRVLLRQPSGGGRSSGLRRRRGGPPPRRISRSGQERWGRTPAYIRALRARRCKPWYHLPRGDANSFVLHSPAVSRVVCRAQSTASRGAAPLVHGRVCGLRSSTIVWTAQGRAWTVTCGSPAPVSPHALAASARVVFAALLSRSACPRDASAAGPPGATIVPGPWLTGLLPRHHLHEWSVLVVCHCHPSPFGSASSSSSPAGALLHPPDQGSTSAKRLRPSNHPSIHFVPSIPGAPGTL